MPDLMLSALPEAVRYSRTHPVILPGDPEPAWLRRNAEHARIIREMKAERRAARGGLRENGLINRLRLALSRD